MAVIGFIGTGVMGAAIVSNMLKNQQTVNVFNRTKSKTVPLVEQGAVCLQTANDVVKKSDIIFTMLGFPEEVEALYLGKHGLFFERITGKIFVDLTTSKPALARKIYEKAIKLGADALDAPVSGGDLGAKKGTLTIMAGGNEQTFEKLLPVFQTFGKTFTFHGLPGNGQHAKMANQIMIAGTMLGLTEMLIYAQKAGLDANKTITTLAGGSAANWSMSNYGPRILNKDFSPSFFVKHFIKDLKIALDEAEAMQLDLPTTNLAKKLYETLAEAGYENEGTQALIKLWWENKV